MTDEQRRLVDENYRLFYKSSLGYVARKAPGICRHEAVTIYHDALIWTATHFRPEAGAKFGTLFHKRLPFQLIDWMRSPANEGGRDRNGKPRRRALQFSQVRKESDPHGRSWRDTPYESSIQARGAGAVAEAEDLEWLLSPLSDRQRRSILMYYVGGYTMKEVGAAIGVCESRVSQEHSALMGLMRERMGAAS